MSHWDCDLRFIEVQPFSPSTVSGDHYLPPTRPAEARHVPLVCGGLLGRDVTYFENCFKKADASKSRHSVGFLTCNNDHKVIFEIQTQLLGQCSYPPPTLSILPMSLPEERRSLATIPVACHSLQRHEVPCVLMMPSDWCYDHNFTGEMPGESPDPVAILQEPRHFFVLPS